MPHIVEPHMLCSNRFQDFIVASAGRHPGHTLPQSLVMETSREPVCEKRLHEERSAPSVFLIAKA